MTQNSKQSFQEKRKFKPTEKACSFLFQDYFKLGQQINLCANVIILVDHQKSWEYDYNIAQDNVVNLIRVVKTKLINYFIEHDAKQSNLDQRREDSGCQDQSKSKPDFIF